MKRRSLVTVASLALLVLAILPALAASVDPVRVAGSSNCATVGSTGDFSLKIEPVVNGTYSGPGGVDIEIILDGKMPHTFGFIMDGGLAHDVLVKGSASNHYDYAASEGGPTDSDFGLTKPNGNSLKHAIFCYDAQTFTISGMKFEELFEGTTGLPGWTIVLDGETTTETGDGGFYSFEGVSAGIHEVCEVQKDGWTQTFPSEGACHTVDTSEGDVTDVDFGNEFQGEAIGCGDSVSTEEGEDASATFTRVASGCNEEDPKSAFVGVDPGDEGLGDETIVFAPRGAVTVDYTGVLTFTKAFDDPSLLVLQYDPDGEGSEDFRDVPACDSDGEAFVVPEGDTWCYFGVDASSTEPGFWTVTWQVFGTGDPRFK
jgi:hypothetical protein